MQMIKANDFLTGKSIEVNSDDVSSATILGLHEITVDMPRRRTIVFSTMAWLLVYFKNNDSPIHCTSIFSYDAGDTKGILESLFPVEFMPQSPSELVKMRAVEHEKRMIDQLVDNE